MNIGKLIAEGRLGEVLDELCKTGDNTAILLNARYSSNEKDNNMGLLDRTHYDRTKAQIQNSILETYGNKSINLTSITNPNKSAVVNDVIDGNKIESILTIIINDNNRYRPEISDEAIVLLRKYFDYKIKKIITKSFDITGEEFSSLGNDVIILRDKLSTQKTSSLKDIVARIVKLIEPRVPDYDALKEAYDLCSGYHLNDTYVEKQLQNRPNDNNVKIEIATRLSEFAARINIR